MEAMTSTAAADGSAPSPFTVQSMDPSALARKRRRDILVGTVFATPDAVTSSKVMKVESDYSSDSTDSSRPAKGTKRPQMKYEPDVPMTKEEASAWRREQRRKRNRESAAACRKRQRDRIAELEVEVGEWKAKFDEALSKLREIEGNEIANVDFESLLDEPLDRCSTPEHTTDDLMAPVSCVSANIVANKHGNYVSPYASPSFAPPLSQPTVTLDIPALEETIIKNPFVSGHLPVGPRVETGQHLKEIITRPAVKITGAVPTPLVAVKSEVDLLQMVPDNCLSATEMKTMPFPDAPVSLVPPVRERDEIPTLGATDDSESEESELGEFLLDAVQWL